MTVTRAQHAGQQRPARPGRRPKRGDPGRGITTVAAGLNTPNPVLYAASLATPANGRLAADAHFSLTIDGNAPVAVTVARAATADNQFATDLLADLNARWPRPGSPRWSPA
ncbi:MAG: hypothetical protein WKF75_00605 [Singulisphaera sp.]